MLGFPPDRAPPLRSASSEIRQRLRGEGKSILFLPFTGEVGWLLMWYVRLVHFSRAARKIVCCQPGQECLFPSADEFFTDWENPTEDARRIGTDHAREWPAIAARFPDCLPVQSALDRAHEPFAMVRLNDRIPIAPRIRRGLKADVCIGTRNRQCWSDKNYPHWPGIADRLHDAGLTFAVIGTRQSSYPLDGMACMSGDYGGFDAGVELLQNCKLFIGADSGAAHLAALVNACPMVVQEVPSTPHCYIPRMARMADHPVIHLPAEKWHRPQDLFSVAKGFISL